jgi:hypothetical protein
VLVHVLLGVVSRDCQRSAGLAPLFSIAEECSSPIGKFRSGAGVEAILQDVIDDL